MSVINSYTNWSPLEEVWLGDVYPADWYDHLPSEVRNCFYEITERTKQDLDIIQKKIESFGVKVCRPNYDSVDNFLIPNTDQLKKPEICPRDLYVTIGQTLYAKNTNPSIKHPWQEHLNRYETQGGKVKNMLIAQKNGNYLSLNGANAVRAGQDIYFDLVWSCQNQNSQQELISLYHEQFAKEFQDYRVHILFNGGHVDGCFALLKPEVILGSYYFDDYATTFPNWKTINLDQPEFHSHKQRSGPWFNGSWWVPGMNYSRAFSEHVVQHAQTWIGDYTETFFEVNCLVIDEKNVIIPGENQKVFQALEKLGITAHSVPFRTRTFWDGGMHCITLDIRRSGQKENYFTDRQESGIIIYN
jgi:hypothetical protein